MPQSRAHAPRGRILKTEPRRETTEVVYYVAMHGLIKIGHTFNVRNRMSSFGLKLTDILAIELGGFDLERERLKQFAASKVQAREWFYPTPEVIDHINSLRRKANLPAVTLVIRDTERLLPSPD